MVERIYVAYRAVWPNVVDLGNGYSPDVPIIKHSFIIYNDAGGSSWYMGGYPSGGHLKTEAGLASAQSFDAIHFDDDETIWAEVARGDDLSLQWERIAAASSYLNDANYVYLGLTQNSNSAVATALRFANIPIGSVPALAVAPGIENNFGSDSPERILSEYGDVHKGAIGFVRDVLGINLGLIQVPHCFPAGTAIQLADGSTKAIDKIRAGDLVAAFAPDAGELRVARVTRTFRNVTTQWVKLTNDLVVTPGHHFFDRHGRFARHRRYSRLGRRCHSGQWPRAARRRRIHPLLGSERASV